MAAYLAAECGRPAAPVMVSATAGPVLSALGSGKIDVAYISPLAYTLYNDEVENVSLFTSAQHGVLTPLGMPYQDNTRLWEGGIMVRVDSGIKSVKDLRGRRFAFKYPRSVDGYVYAAAMLKAAGIDPVKGVKAVDIHGASAVTAVFDKQADAGCADVESIESTLVDYSKIDKLKVLQRTDPIPNGVLVAGAVMAPDTAASLKKAVAEMNSKLDGQLAMKDVEFDRMAPAVDKDFDSLRKVTRLLHMHAKDLDTP